MEIGTLKIWDEYEGVNVNPSENAITPSEIRANFLEAIMWKKTCIRNAEEECLRIYEEQKRKGTLPQEKEDPMITYFKGVIDSDIRELDLYNRQHRNMLNIQIVSEPFSLKPSQKIGYRETESCHR